MKKILQLIGGVWCAEIRSGSGKLYASKDFDDKEKAERWLEREMENAMTDAADKESSIKYGF